MKLPKFRSDVSLDDLPVERAVAFLPIPVMMGAQANDVPEICKA